MTFPAGAAQGPGAAPASYPSKNATVSYDEGVAVGYRYYDARGQRPLFPFGHGLSYATFAHGSLEAAFDPARRSATVAVTVTNTGSRHGTEVVQIYATWPSAASAEPRRLVAFGKVSLARGAAQRLVFTIEPEDLMVWNSGNWTLVPGLYTFAAARASRDITGQRTLTIG